MFSRRVRMIGRLAGVVLAICGIAVADGTETLGPPANLVVQPGTGIAVGGIGLLNQPAELLITVPNGVAIRQVLIYWEGAELTDTAGDGSILVEGVPVRGTLIGGPTFFFNEAYSSAYRADITDLNLVTTGVNALTIDAVDYTREADGAGVLVIYDDGGPAQQINLRDGVDLAFISFPAPRQATVPQTFTFPPSTAARTAALHYFVGSVGENRSSTIRATSGGVVTELFNALNNADGPMWDTVVMQATVPAGASSLTTEIISGGPGPNQPASLTWVTGALSLPPATTDLPPTRVSDSQKGSLLVYPKVELRWNSSGELEQDTFIDLTNDYPADVLVQMYFVNGDPPVTDCVIDGGQDRGEVPCEPEPGWNWVDVQIPLTANQPTYWSAATGLPATGGVSPFTVLDPSSPPGRPDPFGCCDYVLRGFIIAYAVNAVGEEIHWNHLKGDALLINYAEGAAWEYNAYAFQARSSRHGEPTGTAGVLHLDAVEYDQVYDLLLLDFYAPQSLLGSGVGGTVGIGALETDITLLPLDMDLRQETEGPVTTKASFTVWNQNEFKLTGMDLCVTCWDQRLTGDYGVPNHFLRENLQTDKGKAQIDGLASQLCNVDADPADGQPLGEDPRDLISRAAALLGVAAKQIYFGNLDKLEMAGTTIPGMGFQTGQIQVDYLGAPPPSLTTPPVDVRENPIRQPGQAAAGTTAPTGRS